MKIYYDHQICLEQKYGGISRYYYEIIQKERELGIAQVDIQCIWSINKYFEKEFGKKAVSRAPGIRGVLSLYAAYTLNTMKTLWQLQKGYDIVHPTYYNPYVLFCPKRKAKLVITVYDMIHERFPGHFPKKDMTSRMKRTMIFKADHIIAISESTKRDILDIYPEVPDDKISVIYIGSNFVCSKDDRIQKGFPKRYVLFVGRREGYKNFKRFLESMKSCMRKDPDIWLVCIGGGSFRREEKLKMKGYEKRIIQLDADDEVLSYAYSHAQCFVFPSLYEGFGIPTLEAFTCGCPVVLSNTSSMPEVGGDAVLYCDPLDINDMEEKINRMLKEDALREDLRQRGADQLKKFDWSEIARQIIDCYERVLL